MADVRKGSLVLMKINPLNVELNPICHLLALLGAHHIFHVSGLRVKNEEPELVVVLLDRSLNNASLHFE